MKHDSWSERHGWRGWRDVPLLASMVGVALAFVFLMFSITPCKAADWDNTDRVLFGTFVGLQVVDGLQTHNITKHPEQFVETNPLLGSHPSDVKIIAIKSLAIGGVYWATKDASSQTRKTVLAIADAFYVSVTLHNASIGVKIGF